MSISYWVDRADKNKCVESDVIVIGGGIAGLSTCYWLAKQDPGLSISLIDKGGLGAGATGRNAGFITCGSVEHFNRLVQNHGDIQAKDIWQFSETNLKLLKEHIIQDCEAQLCFQSQGSFSLASTEQEFKELKASAALMKKMGFNIQIINAPDIEKRLGAKKFVGGIKYLDDASIDPVKLIEKIKEKTSALNNKFNFYPYNEVYHIDNDANLKIVKTQHHHFKAPIIIFAANGYSPLLNPFFKDKIFPTRGQILITAPMPLFMEAPCYANFVLDYFRQLPSGEVIIGGFRQLQKDAEIGYSDETSDVIQTALERFLNDHLPLVSSYKITHRWSGVMGFSNDGQPMVGALPTDQQIFFLGGFTAHGLGLAFHCAKILVDSLFDRPIPQFISAKRFV